MADVTNTETSAQRAKRDGFTVGFAVACAELARTHMRGDLAKLLLIESGITLEMMRQAGVDQSDIETLR